MKKIALIILLAASIGMSAQQVNTLYFLENSPHRHFINPALAPVSDHYIDLPIIGWTTLGQSYNRLTLSDLVFNRDGKTVTALYDKQSQDALLNRLRDHNGASMDAQLSILNFGFRHKQKGYVHIGVNQKIMVRGEYPKDLFAMALSGMSNDMETAHFDLTNTGAILHSITEVSGGYSYDINDKWSIGGKLKVLIGQGYAKMSFSNLSIDMDHEQWYVDALGQLESNLPLRWGTLGDVISYESNWRDLIGLDFMEFVKPSGYGAAIDLGATYKPIEQVRISASLTDLGAMYWEDAVRWNISGQDMTYTESEEVAYNNLGELCDLIVKNLEEIGKRLEGHHIANRSNIRMINGRMNIGVDANFCRNILGVGVLNQMLWYDGSVYDELTIGGRVSPTNWFSLALSYSLLGNAKYSDFGAGISIMPYDGINLTLTADYIPTSYAKVKTDEGKTIWTPYKTAGMNIGLGLSVVWGTNKKKDRDKDGVADRFDLCPSTPKGVAVDKQGCPLDTDGDGIPDYLDECNDTPAAAYGLTNEQGCPIDTDGDGVADYLDECNDTKPEAYGYVDEKGCDLDSDGDGVPDYKDECPGTPTEAQGFITEQGCEMDTDGDGVPDWRDSCNDTKPGVPVNDEGCDLDTDGDGVPDYLDMCPTVPGLKNNKGCPEIKKEVRTLLNKAMSGIEFETGKATIKRSSYPMLDNIAAVFIENSNYIIEVQGHSDNTGSEKINIELSDKRAKAVREYLVAKGVNGEHITAKGYGPARPIADNKTRAGRAKNRRVEFDITFEEVTYESVLEYAEPEKDENANENVNVNENENSNENTENNLNN